MKKTKLTLLCMALLAANASANSDVATLSISAKALVPQVITIEFADGSRNADLSSELDGSKWKTSSSKQLKITSPVRLTARLASEPKMKGQVQQKSELPFAIDLTSTSGTITLDKANNSIDLYKGTSVGKETIYVTNIRPTKTTVTPDLYIGNTDIVIQTSI